MMVLERQEERGLAALVKDINAEHREFVGSLKKTAEHGIRCGELLSQAKAECAHGTWLEWLETNFEGSVRTAQGYMRLYTNREALDPNTQSVAHLGIAGALRELAEPQAEGAPGEPSGGSPEDALLSTEKAAAALVERVQGKEQNFTPTPAEKAQKKFFAINQRLHELAAGIDMTGGIHQIVKHWPEQNQRIFVQEYRDLGERALRQVEEYSDGASTADACQAVRQREITEEGPEEESSWTIEELDLRERMRSGETVVVNMSEYGHPNLVQWAKDTGVFVRIDRKTEWGNPFEMPADGDRDTVCDNYTHHYLPCKRSLHHKRAELKGKALGCWCAPERCHGDVLKAWAEGAD